MYAHIFASGFVQGVGYRYFVKRTAQKIGLTGWVCNTKDKRVEAVLEGSKEKIEEALEQFKKGSFLSEVKDIQVEWLDKVEGFPDFKIIK